VKGERGMKLSIRIKFWWLKMRIKWHVGMFKLGWTVDVVWMHVAQSVLVRALVLMLWKAPMYGARKGWEDFKGIVDETWTRMKGKR
jgi:hypothetical protein